MDYPSVEKNFNIVVKIPNDIILKTPNRYITYLIGDGSVPALLKINNRNFFLHHHLLSME